MLHNGCRLSRSAAELHVRGISGSGLSRTAFRFLPEPDYDYPELRMGSINLFNVSLNALINGNPEL